MSRHPPCQSIRVGVFGGRRGQSMINVLAGHPDADLVAVCEKDEPVLQQCSRLADSLGCSITGYGDYDHFLEHDMDAVLLANYASEHAPFAVRALGSGRHVWSELMPCQTMAEAVALVEAVERSGCVYTYGENCSYIPAVLEMQRLYEAGDLGEYLHGEGQYIHDMEAEWAGATQGNPKHWRNWSPATFYVTHSTGPIMTITGTRPVRVTGYETLNANKRRYGALGADAAVITCQMDNGGTAVFLPWASLKRDYLLWFSIYGSEGTVEMERSGDWKTVRVHGVPRGSAARHYTVDYPEDAISGAAMAAHGGADFFPIHYFLQAILGRPGKEHAIDIYQALDMTFPGMLGYRSIWEGNRPIDIPDFRQLQARKPYRNDHWCADPALAGPGQPQSWSGGPVSIPDTLYEQ